MSKQKNTQGLGVRGVVRGIDEQLSRLNNQEKALAVERERLLAARGALTGKAVGRARGRRISQDEIAAHLAEHPGSSASQIAGALGVPVTNVSTHLHRAKGSRFERREDGWHLASRAGGVTDG